MEYVLTTQDLVKTYGGSKKKAVHALQGVSLSVGRGEIFGLLGPNGAGKTTFIKCALGVIFQSSGQGSILGQPFGSVLAKERIGYLPENHRYPLHLTGEQVLEYFGQLSGITQPKLEQQVAYTLKLVGMSDWRKVKVKKYSKGMMQRLGLAQALINDPDLIFLDEPTDGVDPVGRKEIRDVLVHLKEEGKTIFLNSHLLSEVELISDRVAIMDHGRLIREGSVAELTAVHDVYSITVANSTLEMATGILSQFSPKLKDTTFEIKSASVSDLNSVLDLLRSSGVLVEAFSAKKVSLEDIFVDLIKTSDLAQQ